MKKHIPNLITLGNLFCGAIATYMAAFGRFQGAALFMLFGILLDFCDGLAARLLKVTSELGKELDSLADLVTSGMAPGFILFNILWNHNTSIELKYVALLIPVFAAYRLAKFNLDETQHSIFRGLPAPANAIIWAGVGLWYPDVFCPSAFCNTGLVVLAAVSLFTDILMVSRIPMISMKFDFHNLSWHSNAPRYIFLIGAVIIIAVFQFVMTNLLASLPFLVLWYILLSLCFRKNLLSNEHQS